jgi:methylmalonyl-CoA/ethylmalonyl-CoA epimerase
MKIHHIGYLVDDIGLAAREFEKLGFAKTGEVVEDKSRDIHVLFLENNGYVVELVQPASEASPVYGLRKKYRNSPYHICYETDDLRREMEIPENTVMLPPAPAPAISGCPNVVFLMNRHAGIVEYVEKK